MTSQKTLRRVLVASLILNAFMASLWVAHTVHRLRKPPAPTDMIAHMTEGMSATDATLFKNALAPHMQDLEENHVIVMSLPARIKDALEAPTFDQAGMKAALDDMRRTREAFETAMGEATLEAAPAMSREGRMKLWHRHGPLGF
jgi:uncharacterized membrane protein